MCEETSCEGRFIRGCYARGNSLLGMFHKELLCAREHLVRERFIRGCYARGNSLLGTFHKELLCARGLVRDVS